MTLLSLSIVAKGSLEQSVTKNTLVASFQSKLTNKQLFKLKKKVLSLSGKAVPTLIEVMKSDKFPDKNRWLATFSLARIMGKKSSPFLVKFMSHPNWVLRMASMKSLLALKETKYGNEYAKALKDKSFIVRRQALETIKSLKLEDKAANVWAMLYDKNNYADASLGKKRTSIIREVVKTVGDLKFMKAKKPLLTMIQKDKYKDIFSEMEYTLSLITGKKSPKGTQSIKRRFWQKFALMEKTF